MILSPSSKAWVDTRQIQRIKEEPFEIKLYDMDDVERLARRRNEEEVTTSNAILNETILLNLQCNFI